MPGDDDVCDVCGKIVDSDDEVPAGWYIMEITRGGETEDDEATALLCGNECAKKWLAEEWGL